ncbi:MAG: hypothetical protein ABSE16_19120 [Verrucomicrobiota bacterium]|jgi:hypothetical protein
MTACPNLFNCVNQFPSSPPENLTAELAQSIAATVTLGDLAAVRERLQQAVGLLADDRAALETALAEREAFLARLYLL